MADASTTAAEPRGATLRHHADFMRLWAGGTISLLGNSFTGLAIQIIAAVSLHATPAQMGLLAATGTAPHLLVGLFAGVYVDRHERRRTLIAGDLARALILATIPVAAVVGLLSVGQLYAVGFLVGTFSVLFGTAHSAYVPFLVEREQLLDANSKIEMGASTAQVAGLSLAGVVIEAITAPLAIVLDCLSYVASALFIGRIRRREERPPAAWTPLTAQLREGFGIVFGNRYLRAFAGCIATSNFFSTAFFALYVLFGTRELGLGAAQLGLVYGIGAVGAPVGALIAGRLAARLGLGRAIGLAALVGAVEVVPVAVATPELAVPLLLASSLLGNFGWTVYNVHVTSLSQAMTPPALLGRMNATLNFVTAGMLPLGGLAGGVLGQWLGLREAIAVAAAGSLLAFVWVALSPVPRLVRLADAPVHR